VKSRSPSFSIGVLLAPEVSIEASMTHSTVHCKQNMLHNTLAKKGERERVCISQNSSDLGVRVLQRDRESGGCAACTHLCICDMFISACFPGDARDPPGQPGDLQHMDMDMQHDRSERSWENTGFNVRETVDTWAKMLPCDNDAGH
jgi:hypothetical protein